MQRADAHGLPLITFVDTPGYEPGRDLEWRGMIRHGAKLVHAYASASVPRIGVILRKAYGGAYIVMDSRTMGNDLVLAWPTAQIAVMGATGAVAILNRRELAEADDPELTRLALETAYEERYLSPAIAAERGFVDAVIDPADTRRHLVAAVARLATKRPPIPPRATTTAPSDPTPVPTPAAEGEPCCSTARPCWSPASSRPPRSRSPAPASPRSRAPRWCSPRSDGPCR